MSKCGVCGGARRAGTGGRATLIDAAGRLRAVIACASCRERAIVLVAMPPATVVERPSDDADVVKVLRGLARKLRGVARADTLPTAAVFGSRLDGFDYSGLLKRDGLEQAADIAEAWARERAARQPVDEPDESIVLAGWVCKTCRTWNSDEKEKRDMCRHCAGPRVVESNVSHAVACEKGDANRRCALAGDHDGPCYFVPRILPARISR